MFLSTLLFPQLLRSLAGYRCSSAHHEIRSPSAASKYECSEISAQLCQCIRVIVVCKDGASHKSGHDDNQGELGSAYQIALILPCTVSFVTNSSIQNYRFHLFHDHGSRFLLNFMYTIVLWFTLLRHLNIEFPFFRTTSSLRIENVGPEPIKPYW